MTTKQGVEFDRIINAPVPGLSGTLRIRKCYLQCGVHWRVTGYEAIFSVANRLPVSQPGSSYGCVQVKMAQNFTIRQGFRTFTEAGNSVLELTVVDPYTVMK